MRIQWSQKAGKDLEHIEAYISQDSPRAAIKVILDVITSVEQLRAFPALGKAGRVAGTRELVVSGKPYVIPYRIRNNVVEILRVFHAAQKAEGK
ncbi:MAG: type II toxin-antitoxin system RelE/ParE family toxin [Thermodesulfovibrionales bacterium]